jgi:tight adherence protein B
MRQRARFGAITGGLVVVLSAGPAAAASPILAAGAPKSWLIILAAIAAGLGAFLLLVILFGGGSSKRDAGIAGRLGSYGESKQKSSGLFGRFGFLRRAAASADTYAEDRGSSRMIARSLEQADIPMTPGEAIIGAIGVAIIVGLLLGLFTGSPLLAVIAGVAVVVVLYLYISSTASKERKKFANQLPEVLTLLATSLRAGYSIMQAIEAVAAEAPEPSNREFGQAMSEIRLGRPMIDALGDVAVRMESQDFEWTVMAIAIQREVGGNLAEVLQSTAETMLYRNRFRREVKALTAEGRLSMYIMLGLPFAIALGIYFLNPGYLDPLFTSLAGIVAIIIAAVSMTIGALIMRKIVDIKV